MTKARDRADRTGSDPIRVGSTVLESDSNNDLVIKDTNNANKKVIASEVHLGTGTDKVILKRSSTDGKLQLQTTDGSTTSNSEVSGDSGGSGGSGGVTVVADTTALQALTNNSVGDLVFVSANNKLYLRQTNGWYTVATVANATPVISSAGNASYSFATDGTPIVITVTATEPEGETITYGHTVTGSTSGIATITQGTGSNVNQFTLTPATSGNGGSFSVVFTAQDPNGNTATSSSSSFSLTFASYGSAVFDGADDYLTIGASSDFALGTGDFTIECWVNFNTTTLDGGDHRRIFCLDDGGDAVDNLQILIDAGYYRHNGDVFLYSNTVKGYLNTDIRSAWHHIAVSRSSGTLRFFLDGVEKYSATNTQSYSPNSGSPSPIIGSRGDLGDYDGYISNLRVVVGTAVYTSNFTVPTSPLTAITNTKLLTANKDNEITDDSNSNHTITKNGNATQHSSHPF